MLWLALLVSIPLNGFNPLYGTAAIVGLFLMLAMAGLVLLLMKGGTKAERFFRAIARKIPFVNAVTVSRVVYQVADRLHELLSQPRLIRRGLLWASINWVLDAAALWVFLRAFGGTVSPVNLIVAFGLANVLAVIPITPGGLGVVEAALTPTLIGFGLTHSAATIGVLAYRFAQFWLPIPLGGIAYTSLKIGRPSRRRRMAELRELASHSETVANKRVWDPVTGEERVVPVTEEPPPEARQEPAPEATNDQRPRAAVPDQRRKPASNDQHHDADRAAAHQQAETTDQHR